jgi:hypothetical protein
MPRRTARRRRAPRQGRGRGLRFDGRVVLITVIIAAIIAIYAFCASLAYSAMARAYTSQAANFSNTSLISPPIRFYVNTAPANATGLTLVSKNQVFCPESANIRNGAHALFAYPYYTELQRGEQFNYTFVYNASGLLPAHVVVLPPFSLVAYGSSLAASERCESYPDALDEVTVNVMAPRSNYTGPIAILIYR